MTLTYPLTIFFFSAAVFEGETLKCYIFLNKEINV